MIEETLKTVRLTHTLIIIMSATIFSFAISLSPNKYHKALDEVSKLKDLKLYNFDDYVYENTKDSANVIVQQCLGFLKDLPSIALNDSSRLRIPYYLSTVDSRYSTLLEIRHFFDSCQVVYFGFSEGCVRVKLIESQTRNKYFHNDSVRTIYQCELRGFYYKEPQKFHLAIPLIEYISERMEVPDATDSARLIISFNPLSLKFGSIYSFGSSYETYDSLYDMLKPLVQITVDLIPHNVGRNMALEWLKSQPESDHLLRKDGGSEKAIPELTKIWEEVKSKTISDAQNYLKEKIAEAPESLLFMNFSVKKKVVLWLAPIATFVLLSFFVAHLKHLKHIGEKDLNMLYSFPWVALYKDCFSKGLTIISVVLFPIIANLTLLLRLVSTESSILLWVWCVISLTGIIICCWISIKTLLRLSALNI